MKKLLALAVSIILAAPLLSQPSLPHWNSGGKLSPLQANMDIRHYTLSLDIDILGQAIDGFLTADFILGHTSDTLLFDLIDQLKVKRITQNKKPIPFTQAHDQIVIVNPKGFKPGRQQIKIEYGGKPPVAARPPWSGGFTWTQDKAGKPWIVINCQLDGAKVYFPCKDHPSDEPNEGVDLFITVPKGLVVAGPGLLQGTASKGTKTEFHWKTNYTISNYCVLFNIADYQVVKRTYTTILGNKVPMEFYVLRQDIDHANGVLDLRERDCHILEKYFGEYPWVKEKMGIAQVPNPGMEHQTMITFAGPFNYQRFGGQYYSANLFHEFGHEWFANKVTNKDWAHMWIQEGIDTYAEALCFRELTGEKGYDSMMMVFRNRIQGKKPLVQGDEVNSQDTYSVDVYMKGALFMHALRFVLGDDIFFPTLKKLATDPKFTYDNFVTTDDVEQLFSKESGKNLKPLFDFYLRTLDRLEITIVQKDANTWIITGKNFPMKLPVEITTSSGTAVMELDRQPIKVQSRTTPIADQGAHYFKRVIIE